jgi:hypothetical protein
MTSKRQQHPAYKPHHFGVLPRGNQLFIARQNLLQGFAQGAGPYRLVQQ